MLIIFLNMAQNTTVSVSDVRFVENHCTHETNCSAGLVIGLMLHEASQLSGKVPTNNTFICYNCTFESNTSGGVIIFASKDVCPYRFGNIVFNKGNWTKNTSPMGAAVFMNQISGTTHKNDVYQSQGSQIVHLRAIQQLSLNPHI